MYRGGGNYVVPMLPRNTQMIANQQMFRRVQEMNEKAVMTEETLFQAYPPVSSSIITGTLRRLMRALMRKGVMTRPISVPQLRSFLVGTALPQLTQKYNDDEAMKKVLGQYLSVLSKRDRFGYPISQITPEYLENLITAIETDKPIPPIRADVKSTPTEETGGQETGEGGETGTSEGATAETGEKGEEVQTVSKDQEEAGAIDPVKGGEEAGPSKMEDDKDVEEDVTNPDLKKAEEEKIDAIEFEHLVRDTRIFSILKFKGIRDAAKESKDPQETENILNHYLELRQLLKDSISLDLLKRKEILNKIINEAAEKLSVSINPKKKEEFLNSEKMNAPLQEYYEYLSSIDQIIDEPQTDVSEGEKKSDDDHPNFPPQSTGEKEPIIGKNKIKKLMKLKVFHPISNDMELRNKLLDSINTGEDRVAILEEIFQEVTRLYFDNFNMGIGQTESYNFLNSKEMDASPNEYYEYLLGIDKIIIEKEPPEEEQTPGGATEGEQTPGGVTERATEGEQTPGEATEGGKTPEGATEGGKTPEGGAQPSPTPKPPKKITSYQTFYTRLQEISDYVETYPNEDFSEFIKEHQAEFNLLKEMIDPNDTPAFMVMHLRNYVTNNHELDQNTDDKKRRELLFRIVSTTFGKNKTVYPNGLLQSLYEENVEGE